MNAIAAISFLCSRRSDENCGDCLPSAIVSPCFASLQIALPSFGSVPPRIAPLCLASPCLASPRLAWLRPVSSCLASLRLASLRHFFFASSRLASPRLGASVSPRPTPFGSPGIPSPRLVLSPIVLSFSLSLLILVSFGMSSVVLSVLMMCRLCSLRIGWK